MFTFPEIHLVEGRGFDHELTDVDGQHLAYIVGDDQGLALARLFQATPGLLRACQDAYTYIAHSPELRFIHKAGILEQLQSAIKAVNP